MAKMVAGQALDMNEFFNVASLADFFEWGDVTSSSSTKLVVAYSEPGFSESLALSGSFSGYVEGYPTTGTLTGGSYALNGANLFSLTSLNMSVQTFRSYVEADNMRGLFQELLKGNDEIVGSSGSDTLYGYAGNDILDGGAGADVLFGGAGNDTYKFGMGDLVLEGSGEGIDTVEISLASFGLGANFENLTYTGTGNFYGSGNELNNILKGGAGNDTLIGGGGIDELRGMGGNDTYNVDNVADVVIDIDGNDTIFATVSYEMTDISGDNLTLIGSAANGYGNDDVNILTGNSSANELYGYGGADTIDGGGGVDHIYGGDGKDILRGGDNNDVVYGHAQDDLVQGGLGNDFLSGGAGNDTLEGGDGDDDLMAGRGDGDAPGDHDTLDGGFGADSYDVNDGDSIWVFGKEDRWIDFGTANPVSKIAIVYDKVSTEIRAYGDGDQYDMVLINNGVPASELAAQTRVADNGTWIRVTRVEPGADLFKFALDQDHALTTATDRWSALFDQAGRLALGQVLDDLGADAAEGAVIAISGTIAGDAAKAVAKVLMDKLGIVTDLIDFKDELQKIIQTWLKGGYDGNAHQAAQDLGVALSDLLLPDGSGVLFKIGTDFVAELLSDVVLGMHDSTAEFYEQIKNGHSTVATDDRNVIVNSGDQTLIYSKGGDDVVIYTNPSGTQQQRAQASAAPLDQTFDGGTGSDTLAYSVNSAVSIDLSTGVAKGVDIGTDTLVSFENAASGSGNDLLVGNSAANKLWGNDGDDIIRGAGGKDQLDGGNGSDVYVLSSVTQYLDARINDTGSAGTDELRFSSATATTLVLPADNGGIERVVIGTGTGTTAITSGVANIDIDARLLGYGVSILGNSGANKLLGTGFGDQLNGGAGIDRLNGNDGDDVLDGGKQADVLTGGAGDDTYIVDDTSDAVIEAADGGIDTVLASVAVTLKANVENVVQTGVLSRNAHGNALDNVMEGNAGSSRLWGHEGNDTLIGNDGTDQLDGGTGDDAMLGGTGNDLYVVDSAGDTVTELAGEGRDTVRSSIAYTLGSEVEWLELQGGANIEGTGNGLANVLKGNDGDNALSGLSGNDKLYGGAGSDRVDGGEGNDVLEGGTGRDEFTGGTGSDRFIFREGDLGGASIATADVIHDFVHAQGDKIRLDAVDANSTLAGNQAFAFLGTGAFTNAAGQLRFEQSGGNTFVQGDIDGDGVADFVIQLDGTLNLVGGDFIL